MKRFNKVKGAMQKKGSIFSIGSSFSVNGGESVGPAIKKKSFMSKFAIRRLRSESSSAHNKFDLSEDSIVIKGPFFPNGKNVKDRAEPVESVVETNDWHGPDEEHSDEESDVAPPYRPPNTTKSEMLALKHLDVTDSEASHGDETDENYDSAFTYFTVTKPASELKDVAPRPPPKRRERTPQIQSPTLRSRARKKSSTPKRESPGRKLRRRKKKKKRSRKVEDFDDLDEVENYPVSNLTLKTVHKSELETEREAKDLTESETLSEIFSPIQGNSSPKRPTKDPRDNNTLRSNKAPRGTNIPTTSPRIQTKKKTWITSQNAFSKFTIADKTSKVEWDVKFNIRKKKYYFQHKRTKEISVGVPEGYKGSLWTKRFDALAGRKFWQNVVTLEERDKAPEENNI